MPNVTIKNEITAKFPIEFKCSKNLSYIKKNEKNYPHI